MAAAVAEGVSAEEVAFQFHPQSAAWREQAGCRTEDDVEAWERAGCPHPSEAEPWARRGVTAEQAQLFLDGDYGPDEVDDWVQRFDGNPDLTVSDLAAMAAHGFGPCTTAVLRERGDDLAARAAKWNEAGFGPRARGEWAALFEDPGEARQWRQGGVPSWRADEYLAAGVTDCDTARDWCLSGFTGSECKVWTDLGVTVSDAKGWLGLGFNAHTAHRLIADGWTSAQARDAGIAPLAARDGEDPR